MHKKGFTLIELLIVVGIIAVLGSVTILVIRPAELFRQARDSQRMTELSTINNAVNLYNTFISVSSSTPFLGASNIIYVSKDSTNLDCSGLGLPTPPPGWTYRCKNSTDYRKVNGDGWIPINFTSIATSTGSLFASLPIDPVNDVSQGYYYTYVAGGSWALASLIESEKYLKGQASNDGGKNPGKYEIGTDLSLNSKADGLVGYWSFDEGGTSSTAIDSSGNGINGTWNGTGIHYAAGKVGNYAGQFNGLVTPNTDYVDLGNNSNLDQTNFTFSAWVYINHFDSIGAIFGGFNSTGQTKNYVTPTSSSNKLYLDQYPPSGTLNSATSFTSNNWYHIAAVQSSNYRAIYVNGVLDIGDNTPEVYSGSAVQDWAIGRRLWNPDYRYRGLIDDARYYNRVLSAAEIQAIYNATK